MNALTPNPLRYQILDDGRVLVTLSGQVAHLEPGLVKRFAWSVLSDLDPDGAEDAGYHAPAIILDADVRAKDDRKGPWQIVAILRALVTHPHYTARQVAHRIDCEQKVVAVQLSRMKAKGWTAMSSIGRANAPATWLITDDGLAALKRYEPGEDALLDHCREVGSVD